MNKRLPELINYAIMPGHVMKTVSMIYEICTHGKNPEFSLRNFGQNFSGASEVESPLVIVEGLVSQLIISEYISRKLKRNGTGVSNEFII